MINMKIKNKLISYKCRKCLQFFDIEMYIFVRIRECEENYVFRFKSSSFTFCRNPALV